ncbi:MAG: 16S rRNA (cytidine(1402)-2'-O)-methyltransferase, partial [Tannerellaceae bacterium]|nr:16S rRNA (cytidine(1402)-2'-O)-methyltransferase [Tannerellaceae bacterium]
CFEGFLPQKKGRQSRLKKLSGETRTIIFYESPYRLVKTLAQLGEYFGNERQISVSRELSKMYEETVRGTIGQAVDHFKMNEPRGEIVMIVAGLKEGKKETIEKNKF